MRRFDCVWFVRLRISCFFPEVVPAPAENIHSVPFVFRFSFVCIWLCIYVCSDNEEHEKQNAGHGSKCVILALGLLSGQELEEPMYETYN